MYTIKESALSSSARNVRFADRKSRKFRICSEHSSKTAAAHEGTSKCPLAGMLQSPPAHKLPWWKGLMWVTDPAQHQREVMAGHGSVVSTSMFFQDVVIVADPELAMTFMTAEGSAVKCWWPESLAAVLGKHSVLLVSFQKHRMLRKIINSAFTQEEIAGYVPQLEAIVERYLHRWAERREAQQTYHVMRRFTLEAVLNVVLGMNLDDQQLSTISDMFKDVLAGPWQAGAPS